jgi:hypothetical protein
VTYTTNAGTVIACDAEANSSSEKTRFTAADKLASHVATIQKRLEGVSSIAGNTNQYFWHRETGTDTGAHITEVPQEEWDDPDSQNYHSGSNLLLRGNGIAVRDGMTELAQFRGDGTDFYDQYGGNTFNFSTNGPSNVGAYSYEEENDNVITNDPWIMEVKYPYFCNFTNDLFYFHVQVNGEMRSFESGSWSSDFTETWTSGYGDITASYSYVDRTITFTYIGSTSPISIYAYLTWSANIVSSSFSFGTRDGAIGANTGTIGESLQAEYANQVAIGKYNLCMPEDIFEVGYGETDRVRRNLLELKKTTGNLWIRGTYSHASDRRLKTHKSYLGDDAVQFIQNLKPVYYTKDGEDHVGFYAQDVAAVDPWNSMTGESGGYMTLSYTEIIAPLVKYCQSLEKRIAELEGR